MTLSIVMPTYNDAHYIREALDAILNQSYKDFELIIINDASLDNSEQIIKEYKNRDSRIVYIKNEQNLGICKSVNIGFRAAKGKYILGASSDDWIAPDFLNNGMTHLLKNPEIGICFFDIAYFENGAFRTLKCIPSINAPKLIQISEMWKIYKKYNFCIHAITSIIKKSEAEKWNYYNEEVIELADMILAVPISLETPSLYVPEVGGYIRIPPESERRNAGKTRKDLIKERSDILILLKQNNRLFKYMCYSTLLPRSIHYSFYTMFLRPKHWDMALPMLWVKFKLMFTKIARKRREQTCLIRPN